ncbi:dienelactone hydrolase family protein [bacterium]|nr:dienelactone hydrolase family protein [bacterium]
MPAVPRRFAVDDGSVSGAVSLPPRPRGVTVVVAHGAGTALDHPFLVAFAGGLAARGIAAVRFNFLYTERGGRVPDRAPLLEACYRAVLAAVRADPALAGRLVIGGKSMGGRIASHLAAAGEPVDGLLFLGYPLHPAGRPRQLRAAHLPRIQAPMLFLTGSRDALCPLSTLRPILAALPTATLHVVDDADHSFAVRKQSGRGAAQVMDELLSATCAWLG